jgi:hypothetical protein
MMRTASIVLLALAPHLVAAADKSQPTVPTPEQLIGAAVQRGERVWKLANDPTPRLTSREIFRYALALCEARKHPERLAVLFDVAARMQDRDRESRTYGNFQWYWQEAEIKDRNAVDFCMMGGSLMWLRHRDTMPPGARKTLREILDHAVEGCLRHRVRSTYTNIAFMNAMDLILLGEGLGRKDATDEGYARLERAFVVTWEWGTHEYCSPTYYGVDVEVLQLTEAFCKRDRGRQQARALLELFWTDIAVNWYAPTHRLGGARSRDYSYLYGTGPLDTQMWLAGWLSGELIGRRGVVYPAVARWQPLARLREMNLTRYPRLVRQSWGPALGESRTFYLCEDVGLSISGALYNYMDLPLTVDLLGGRHRPRCYFIPDGRHDPYGKAKIAAGPHSKTLHLRPFWTGVQRRVDALGLVVYRQRDLPEEFQTLESHFVLRRDVEGFWIGDRKVDLSGKEAAYDVPIGVPLVIRHGTAAVGIRVPWAYSLDGKPVGAKLVYDGNAFGVVRLTVAHHGETPIEGKGMGEGDEAVCGAAFWVRVGSGLKTTEQFEQWRREFTTAKASATGDREKVRLEVAGVDGPVVVAASAPWRDAEQLTPAPTRGVLEIDGKDVGREILGKVEPIRGYLKRLANLPTTKLREGKGTFLEAESGLVVADMVVAKDDAASGGSYVWTPGEPGQRSTGSGSILWELTVDKAARYYLWGRVLAPTSSDDSFYVRVIGGAGERVGGVEWHTGTHRTWGWSPARDQNAGEPTGLPLPAGKIRIEIRTREDGAKIDRLYLTTDPKDRPE